VNRLLPALALVPLLGCVGGEREEERHDDVQRVQSSGAIRLTAEDRETLGIEARPVEIGDVPEVRLRVGRALARPADESLVMAPVTGRIAAAPTRVVGDSVAAGQVILTLVPIVTAGERVSLDLQTADLDGQLRAARSELELRRTAAERAQRSRKDGLTSEQELERAETDLDLAKSRVWALEQARIVGRQGAPLDLLAPAAGQLVALDATVGAVVQPGEVLARIVSGTARWVDVLSSPEDPVGQRYEVRVAGTWTEAKLAARGGFVGADGMRRDRLEIDSPSLLPGAPVAVRVIVGSSKGISVPETGLVPVLGGDQVYVEGADETFTPRDVVVSARFGGQARIASGLAAGERVAVTGAMALRGESLRASLGEAE
jgi:multidrug efflux pump subunit AcrA (membrane-fusion protein)